MTAVAYSETEEKKSTHRKEKSCGTGKFVALPPSTAAATAVSPAPTSSPCSGIPNAQLKEEGPLVAFAMIERFNYIGGVWFEVWRQVNEDWTYRTVAKKNKVTRREALKVGSKT
jgi:hypothetical protein